MLFTSGESGASPLSFNTESNIAGAIRDYGALYCSFTVYASFMSYTGGVYMGRQGASDARNGGHAVTCYGFGTTSDGTPYWKCINSWGGGWGIAPKGEFMIHRPSGSASRESGLLDACYTAAIDYDDIFPAGAVPPSPPVYCADAAPADTGINSGGTPMSCSQLSNYCTGHSLSQTVRGSCPITCGTPGCTTTPISWTTPSTPTPEPAPTPTPAASPPAPVRVMSPSPSPWIYPSNSFPPSPSPSPSPSASPPPSPSPSPSPSASPSPSPALVPTPAPSSSPSGGSGDASCSNTCSHPGDGDCDDGGPGSDYEVCLLGTDCTDCGARGGATAKESGSTLGTVDEEDEEDEADDEQRTTKPRGDDDGGAGESSNAAPKPQRKKPTFKHGKAGKKKTAQK